MNKQRDHVIEILYYNYRTIKDQILALLTFIIAIVGTADKYENWIKIGFIIACCIAVIYSFLLWYYKVYEFKDGVIEYSHGVINRTRNDIPIQRIKSINTSDTVIKRLLKISNLHIELIGGGEVSFVLSNKQIKRLRETIFSQIRAEERMKKRQVFKPLEYMLIGTTNVSFILASTSITFSLASYIFHHYPWIFGFEETIEEDNGIIGIVTDVKSFFELPLESIFHTMVYALIAFLIFLVIAIILSSIIAYLTYSSFHIDTNSKEIEISYGKFTKKHFIIPLKQIRSVQIVEPFVLKIFGYAQIKIDNIGLNHTASKSLYITPIIKKNKVNRALSHYLNMFENRDIEMRPSRTALPIYLFLFSYKFVLGVIILSIVVPITIYGLALLPIPLFIGYRKWKYTGLSFDNHFLTYSRATLLKNYKIIIRKKFVETTGVGHNIVTAKNKKANYYFALFSEDINDIYECMLLEDNRKKDFLNYLC